MMKRVITIESTGIYITRAGRLAFITRHDAEADPAYPWVGYIVTGTTTLPVQQWGRWNASGSYSEAEHQNDLMFQA